MDKQLMDALRVVGLDVHQHRTHPQEAEWFCTTPLGEIGPFRSEEWALVEGVRALTRHAGGTERTDDHAVNPFERFLRDIQDGRGGAV